MPIESINIGNIIRLINEIAATKAETIIEIPPESEELWITKELIDYLNSSTQSQRLLLAAIVQSEKEPATSKTVTFLMKSIAKKNPSEMAAKKFTGHHIAGARAGLTMRRNNLHREDIIESSWSNSEKDNMYKIKNQYKQIVIEWAKKENLWITEDFK